MYTFVIHKSVCFTTTVDLHNICYETLKFKCKTVFVVTYVNTH